MKIRIPLILKNAGIISTCIIGAVVCVGILAGGVAATTQKDWVKEHVTSLNNILDNVHGGLKTTSSSLDEVKNYSDLAYTALNDNILTQLKKIKEDLKSITSSSTFKTLINSSSIEQIDKQIDTIISSVESINVSTIKGQIDDSYKVINGLISEDGTVTKTLNNVNDYIKAANQDGSKEWEYYDLVAKILTGVGAGLVLIILVGAILLFALYKRVDGVFISRSNFKKNLAKHVKRILVKNPELIRHLQKKYGDY